MMDLDDLMNKLGVRPHDRTTMRQALIDTYEPGKAATDWVVDAVLVLLMRRGDIPPVEEGSPAAIALAKNGKVQ